MKNPTLHLENMDTCWQVCSGYIRNILELLEVFLGTTHHSVPPLQSISILGWPLFVIIHQSVLLL